MSIQARQSGASIKKLKRGKGFLARWFAVYAIFLSCPASLVAQSDEQQPVAIVDAGSEALEEITEPAVSLPDSHQIAMALATPSSRNRALLDLATALNTLSRAGGDSRIDHKWLAKGHVRSACSS